MSGQIVISTPSSSDTLRSNAMLSAPPEPTRIDSPPLTLNDLINALKAIFSPLEQGQMLGSLDALTGNRAATDALVAGATVDQAKLAQAAPVIAGAALPADRQWPVAGDGAPAVKDAIGPNGAAYSDGRYSPSGAYRGGRPHYGIDLPAKIGDPVSAAAAGTVYGMGTASGWGKYVAIKSPDGFVQVYAHLSSFANLKAGQAVAMGDAIGKVGNSGNAAGYGTHLHFEVRQDIGGGTLGRIRDGAVSVDPNAWMAGKAVLQQ